MCSVRGDCNESIEPEQSERRQFRRVPSRQASIATVHGSKQEDVSSEKESKISRRGTALRYPLELVNELSQIQIDPS